MRVPCLDLALAAGFLLVASPPAGATPVTVDWELAFVPPSPCSVSVCDSTLSGSLAIGLRGQPGPPNVITGLALGERVTGSLLFDVDLSGTPIFVLSFGGLLENNPGPPTIPVYALASRTDAGSDPGAAPLIELNPGPPTVSFPLFAFASPGEEIGFVKLTFSVPEPGASWLAPLLAGSLGAGLAGRRRAERSAGRLS